MSHFFSAVVIFGYADLKLDRKKVGVKIICISYDLLCVWNISLR